MGKLITYKEIDVDDISIEEADLYFKDMCTMFSKNILGESYKC